MRDFNQEEFEKLKIAVNNDYKKIGSIYSPALKSKIVFNSNGIYHLYYDYNRSKRSKFVQWNKIRFFKSAVSILKASTTIQEYRCIIKSIKDKSNFNKNSTIEWFAFWSIISFVEQIRVKVIVRRVGGKDGFYHFWSVMPYWSLRQKERIIGLEELEDE